MSGRTTSDISQAFKTIVTLVVVYWVLSYIFSDEKTNTKENGYRQQYGSRAIRRPRQGEEGVLLGPSLLGENGAGVYTGNVLGNNNTVEVDEFTNQRQDAVFRPVAGNVTAGPVKEWDTYVNKPVVVGHHGVPTTKTEYTTVTVPQHHAAVPYQTQETKEVSVTIHPAPVEHVEYKPVQVSVPTAPYVKMVKKPYRYWTQPPAYTKTEYKSVPKYHAPQPYAATEKVPVSVTVQPPDIITQQAVAVPKIHPAKTYYTTETLMKPVKVRVPHRIPGYSTNEIKYVPKVHHQAPITKTVVENVGVTKFKPGYTTTALEPYQVPVIPPRVEKIGYKDEPEIVRPPPHLETKSEPYTVTEQPADYTETKAVNVEVTKYRPPYTTYKQEQVPHTVVVPGKDYSTIELEKQRIHHKVQEEQQLVAESGPVEYVGPTNARPQIYQQDRADYAERCSTSAECAGKPCGLQYSSAVGGYVRVCCPSGLTRTEPDGRVMCVPLERRLRR